MNTEQGDVSALPNGYRQSLVTAITVFLGFSLYFIRYWGLENPGHWGRPSVVTLLVAVAGLVIQFVALFRSLDVRDNELTRYRLTVRILFGGLVTFISGVLLSIWVAASPRLHPTLPAGRRTASARKSEAVGREAEVPAALNQPNIAATYGFAATDPDQVAFGPLFTAIGPRDISGPPQRRRPLMTVRPFHI
jgi:hypothetical protein